jgi:hypothetical protein
MTTPYEKLHQCGHASSGFLKDGKYQSHDSRAAGLYSGALACRESMMGRFRAGLVSSPCCKIKVSIPKSVSCVQTVSKFKKGF